MKIRRKLRKALKALRIQMHDALWESHDHDQFFIRGTGCVLCKLLDNGAAPLAICQMARQQGYLQHWLPAEKQIHDLMGEEAFRRKLQRSMDVIRNMPKKICERCEGTIIVFLNVKKIAHHIARYKEKIYKDTCHECGHVFEIAEREIPSRLMRVVYKHLRKNPKLKKWPKFDEGPGGIEPIVHLDPPDVDFNSPDEEYNPDEE